MTVLRVMRPTLWWVVHRQVGMPSSVTGIPKAGALPICQGSRTGDPGHCQNVTRRPVTNGRVSIEEIVADCKTNGLAHG